MRSWGSSHHERGAVLVWVAISLPVLVGMAAFTIDAGSVFVTRAELQNAADAASLETIISVDLAQIDSAGERAAAEAAGTAIADLNHTFGGGNPQMTYEWGRWHEGAFFADVNGDGVVYETEPDEDFLGVANAVRAVAERPGFPTVFARVLGIDTVDIGAAAVASKRELVIDFEGLAEGAGPLASDPAPPGQQPSNFLEVSSGNGMRGEVGGTVRIWSTEAFGPMVFDSTCSGGASGGDPDLCVSGQGNVLIVSEDGDAGDPDDNAGGFQMTIDFTNLDTGTVNLQNLKGIDVDPNEKMRFRAFNAMGGLVAESFICGSNVSDPECDDTVVSGDNTVASVFPDLVEDVAILTIDHDSSGAIDDIGFDTIVQLNS